MTLYIAYPQHPKNAVQIVPNVTFDTDYPYTHSIDGERANYAQISSASNLSAEYDLGVGGEATASYLIIARADKLQAQGVTEATLSGATAIGGSYSTVTTDASFASATLYGPRSDDYLATFTESSSYRAWKIAFTASSSAKTFSKIYFGNALTFAKEPRAINFSPDFDAEGALISASGAVDRVRMEEPRWRFNLTWTVTDDELTSFMTKISSKADRSRFFLYTTSNHHTLNDLRCVHVRLISHATDNASNDRDYNRLSTEWIEELG
jgi:hypothetical protein